MKCKVCESELRPGTKRCPHCGTDVPAAGKNASEVFKWNVQDFPKPKKKSEVAIDWSEGKIYNKASGKVYNQSECKWSEPEEVKNLFNFDKKNEEFQEVLDRQMDSIEVMSVPEPVRVEEPMVFDLPSTMDMGIFEELISDDVELILPGQEESIKIEAEKPSFFEVFETAAEPVVEEVPVPSTAEGMLSLDEVFKNESKAEEKVEEKAKKTDDEIVFDGIRKLMAAEEKLKQDMERVTYLTPEESEKAEKIEDNSNKLRFVPTITFRSLEDEYEAYRSEKSVATVSTDQGNEVKVEISEPSGTTVTVKTQEIKVPEDENCKTQEVQLEKLTQGPTDVQVSVEVNAAGENTSIEVTRKHDGSTVVKTVGENTTSEHVVSAPEEAVETPAEEPVAEEAPVVAEPAVEEVAAAEPVEEKLTIEDIAADENESFWKESDTSNTGASRMTITDIFGPDARRIIEGGDDADQDIENSLILDIKPEDIAVTKEQSESIKTTVKEESEVKVEEAAVAAAVAAETAKEESAETPAEEPVTEEAPVIPEVSVPEKKSGFGAGAKALIVILIIILLAEMSIIGIKLFAPDSQAALFIEKTQDAVVSMIQGDDDTNVTDDTQQGGDVQESGDPTVQTNPIQQPADPANTAGTAAPTDTAGTVPAQ